MLMRTLVLLISILMLATVASVAIASERTPPGSYLQYRATTVAGLRHELATNQLVQARYSKHFGISAEEFDKFLANNVQLVALKSPLLVDTWYVDRWGKATTKRKLLPTGTMVFSTKGGQAFLTWSCGNPLRADLPVDTKVKAATSTITSPLDLPADTKVLAAPVETITSALIDAPPATAEVAITPVESASALSYVSAPAVSMPPIIAGLGALGALGGLAISRSSTPAPPPPVPEPSSIVVMGMGMSLLPTIYRLRRRKHQAD